MMSLCDMEMRMYATMGAKVSKINQLHLEVLPFSVRKKQLLGGLWAPKELKWPEGPLMYLGMAAQRILGRPMEA